MKRRGYFSEEIETFANFEKAYLLTSKNKHKRKSVVEFSANLEDNLNSLLDAYSNRSFTTSPYRFMTVKYPKVRQIGMLPFEDHVYHWALLNATEQYFSRSFSAYTYGGIEGRGPHAYMNAIRNVLIKYPHDTTHYLLIDIQKFYPNINHKILKRQLRTRIKDSKLLDSFDEIIDKSGALGIGLYPGSKLAQFFSLVYLYMFDHDLKRCFYVNDSPGAIEYYTNEYINHRIHTARTENDLIELSKGVDYLSVLFKSYLKRLRFCFRIADDVLILHRDKSFLHILVTWIGVYLARELKLTLNHKWKIRPVSEGIDTGGYVHYHTHVRVRKRNKKALCVQVAKLEKKGYDKETIRKAVSSRTGFVQHANSYKLLSKLGMETKKRLGQRIRDKKSPWVDLGADRKRRFEDILYDMRLPEDLRGDEEAKLIELLDYKIEDSKIEKNIDGTPKKCLIIRYMFEGQEWYSYTGSSVLIDQAANEFTTNDLPAPTVVKVVVNKFNKKFYRFT